MPFQNQPVTFQQAPGVQGDFATSNPYSSAPAPEAGYVAGSVGCSVGLFAWVDPTDSTRRKLINSSATSIPPVGFVLRANQALITGYLQEASMVIPSGMPVVPMVKGDYFCKITVSAATPGQKAFASLTDGSMQPGTAGATIVGYVETPFIISQGGAVGELAIISQ